MLAPSLKTSSLIIIHICQDLLGLRKHIHLLAFQRRGLPLGIMGSLVDVSAKIAGSVENVVENVGRRPRGLVGNHIDGRTSAHLSASRNFSIWVNKESVQYIHEY